jgi:perosamine synthetase
MAAPLPRFRIYTRPKSYAQELLEWVTVRTHVGEAIQEFERAVAERIQMPHGLATPTARTGIYLAVRHLIKPGQKVILSPITISDVVNMVLCAGGIPVFADVKRETCNIDPDEIERLIDENTGAVLITHLHGLASDMDRIVEICRKKNIPLIEDCAQAFSSRYKGKPVGSFGAASVFSFGMYKNVNSFYGGMVLTRDAGMYESLRAERETWPFQDASLHIRKVLHAFATDISTHPLVFRSFTFWLFRYAFLNNIDRINKMVIVDQDPQAKEKIPTDYLCRMRPMQARICLSQLENVEKYNSMRIDRSKLYYEGLKDIPELILPPMHLDGSHLYTYYPIQYKDRHALAKHAMRHNRDFVLSHYHNCAALECFKKYFRSCPNADAVSKELIYLPSYPRYSVSEVEKNIKVIRAFFGK